MQLWEKPPGGRRNGSALNFLFEVDPTDPATTAAAGAVLLLVAWAACYIPARRAARVDPMRALRIE